MNTRLSITRLALVLPLAAGLLLAACGPKATPVPPTATPHPLASRAVTYTYDDAGRLTRAEYDSGARIAYTYDNAGNLLSREVQAASGLSSSALVGAALPQPPTAATLLALGLLVAFGIFLNPRRHTKFTKVSFVPLRALRGSRHNPQSAICNLPSAIRLLLALSLAAGTLGLSTGAARAFPGGCDSSGRPILLGYPGATYYVSRPGQPATTYTTGTGTSTHVIGGPNEFFQVTMVGGSAGQEQSLGSILCAAPGPVGNQGQQNIGDTNTAGNTGGNNGTVGDPVSTSIGEYSFSLPLLDLGGPIPIRFALYYATGLNKPAEFRNDPFGGDPFTHTYAAFLDNSKNGVVTVHLDGNVITFQKSGGQWQVVDEQLIYQLQETPYDYFMLDPATGLIYGFIKDKMTQGRSDNIQPLFGIGDRSGNWIEIENDFFNYQVVSVSGAGRSLHFTYTMPADDWDWPHLASVYDDYGRTITFNYQVDRNGAPPTVHLSGVTDVMGNTTAFNHTGPLTDTVVSGLTLPLGNTPYTQTVEPMADSAWRVVSQTDAYGNTTALDFAEIPGTTITDPVGNASQHTHTDGRLTALTDAAGSAASIGYDDAGRRASITDRLGDTTTITYHPETGKPASITNARGDTMAFTYTPQEQIITTPDGSISATFTFYNLTRVDYPDGTFEERTYDERGNVISRTDRAGMTRTHTYNDAGQVLTAANPTGGVTTFTYNDDATLASRTDPETGTTTFAYDDYKRLNTITHPDGTSLQMTYDLNDRITSLTDENGSAYAYEYDANGNLVKITDPVGGAFSLSYDLMDRLTQITDRVGQAFSLAYDPMGRLSKITDPVGRAFSLAYDPRGWRNAVTIGGQTWTTGYDAEGVPSSRTTPLGNTTSYQTDSLGLLTAATDPLGNTTTFTRDALNRITGVTDPLGRATNYTYDARGLLASVSPPLVGAATYTRNELGLITGLTDLNGEQWAFDYSPIGRLTSTADPLGNTAQYAYDDRGRLTTTTLADGAALNYAYDAAGNLTGLGDQSGLDLAYTYDPLNRLTETDGVNLTYDAEGRVTNTQSQNPNSQIPNPNFGATYDAAGRVQTLDYGAFTVTYVYDPATGLLASVADSLTNAKIEFTYAADRRLVGLNRSNGVNTELTWDAAGRLIGIRDAKTSEVSQTSEVLNLQYTLDAAGQVTAAQMTAPLDPASNFQLQTSNFQYDKASQVNTDGYKYDALGRLTQSPDGEFKWDALSRLVGIGDTALTYNGFGDVVSRAEGDRVTRYAYNYALGLAPIVAESEIRSPQSEIPLRYYVWSPGGQLLYVIDAADSNAVSFYHFDRAGSTLALTDAGGAITDAYTYDPYGQLLAHEGDSTQPFTFVGRWGVRQEGDPSTGSGGALYHMRARYYDPAAARFLSRDPIWPVTSDPRQINPYQYAIGSPLSRIDPTGTVYWFVAWAALYLAGEAIEAVTGMPVISGGASGFLALLLEGTTELGSGEFTPEQEFRMEMASLTLMERRLDEELYQLEEERSQLERDSRPSGEELAAELQQQSEQNRLDRERIEREVAARWGLETTFQQRMDERDLQMGLLDLQLLNDDLRDFNGELETALQQAEREFESMGGNRETPDKAIVFQDDINSYTPPDQRPPGW